MPATAILFGRLLVLLGIIGYGYGIYSGAASFTALIPSIFGILLMVLGHIASSKESLRKHIMHVAVVIGLLGFLLPAGRILSTLGNFTLSFAAVMLIVMAVLCGTFVALCVKSFIDARRSGAV